MLRIIFLAMLQGASSHYGDTIGLAPMVLASPPSRNSRSD